MMLNNTCGFNYNMQRNDFLTVRNQSLKHKKMISVDLGIKVLIIDKMVIPEELGIEGLIIKKNNFCTGRNHS